MEKPLYYIALLLPEKISEQVTLLKNEMADRYGTKHALKSPPHITLQMPFRYPQKEENRLVEKLYLFADQRPGFEILLSGFGSFPPRVIYIDVVRTQVLEERFFDLRDFLHQETGLTPSQKIRNRFSPHVTLATRDLKKEFFLEAWRIFKRRDFQAVFFSRDLALLKHNGKIWKVHKRFPWKETKDGPVFEDLHHD